MSVYVFWVPCSGWEFTLGISACSMFIENIRGEACGLDHKSRDFVAIAI